MKVIRNSFLLFLFMGSLFAVYSYRILQIQEGPHGGAVKRSGKYHIEMKNQEDAFYAFLLDDKMQPVKNEMVTGSVRLFYNDETSEEFKLKKFEEDGFVTESKVPDFISCKITFTVFGKHVWANFGNTPLIVKDKK